MSEIPKQNTVVSRKSNLVVAIIIGVIFLVWAGVGVTLLYQKYFNGFFVTQRDTSQEDGNQISTPEEATISNVFERVSPSVVSIVTSLSSGSSDGFWSSMGSQEAAGTGIIVGKDGYILTNKHVVDGAKSIKVISSTGEVYEDVDMIGVDPLNDIAFLKIKNVSDLPVATLGDSTTLKIGQQVIAIGNSLGQYQNTVTSGIISGTNRPIQAATESGGTEMLTDLIQTDAAINPGNSGGPLLNAKGQVIGINTAIAQDAEGIGFAIPINSAKGILKQILDGGGFKRAYLGVQYLSITPEVAREYKLPVTKGAYVYTESSAAVVAGGPADKAGIKKGDIILSVNGVDVGERGSVASLVSEYAPGDVVEIKVRTGNDTRTVKVTLGAYSD